MWLWVVLTTTEHYTQVTNLGASSGTMAAPFFLTSHHVPQEPWHVIVSPWCPGLAGVQAFAQKQLFLRCAMNLSPLLARLACSGCSDGPASGMNKGATGPALLQKALLSGCSLKIITIFYSNHLSSQKPCWLLISQIYPVPLWAFW